MKVWKIVLYIILFLLLVNLIRIFVVGDSQFFGFSKFTELLQSTNNIAVEFPTFQNLTITADWGAFTFLKNAINVIIQIPTFLLWFARACITVIMTLVQVLNYIFVL